MKITIFAILSLANCCFFIGVRASAKVNCRKYPHDKHGQIRCPRIHRAVCGTDGLTYGNECMLCAKIMCGIVIDLAHEGPCDICSEFTKPIEYCPMNYDPVCGTDGVTYGNKCEFCKRQQTIGKDLQIAHEGDCEKKICAVNTQISKLCNDDPKLVCCIRGATGIY